MRIVWGPVFLRCRIFKKRIQISNKFWAITSVGWSKFAKSKKFKKLHPENLKAYAWGKTISKPWTLCTTIYGLEHPNNTQPMHGFVLPMPPQKNRFRNLRPPLTSHWRHSTKITPPYSPFLNKSKGSRLNAAEINFQKVFSEIVWIFLGNYSSTRIEMNFQ